MTEQSSNWNQMYAFNIDISQKAWTQRKDKGLDRFRKNAENADGGDQTPKACESPTKMNSPWPPPPPPGVDLLNYPTNEFLKDCHGVQR